MQMRSISTAFLALAALLAWGCQTEHERSTQPAEAHHGPGAAQAAVPTTAPAGNAYLFDGMGSHHRPVSTTSAMAQRFFDQGLTWTFAFNHGEAIRSFRASLSHDPNLAIAWWGIALCNGPHINNPAMSPENNSAAWQAVQKANALKDRASPVEQALVEAVARRYAQTPPADRRPLDEAYAAAMADVHQKFPADNDVAVLYAESMMDLQPWDLYTLDGKPKGQAPRIVAVLEKVLQRDADHPGAIHLYIHAVEASDNPGRALAAADRLRNLVPAAGHLLHMPSHIDVRTGRWAAASDANAKAIEADGRYRRIRPRSGFWNVYMLHNRHFLAYACMMEGRGESAVQAARQMVASVPEDWAREHAAIADAYMAISLEALMRFGQWDQVLREPAPPDYLPITTTLWRFTRGIAFAAKGQVQQARQEQAEFEKAAARVKPDALMAINPAKDVLQLARHMLAGEIAFREGKVDESVRRLRQAVKIEDGLRYMEPPDWVQPVRHTLGAVLVSAGRHAEAERIYREDLARLPENGWALLGLADALKAQGKDQEAQQVEKRYAAAWSRADVKPQTSCMCVTKE